MRHCALPLLLSLASVALETPATGLSSLPWLVEDLNTDARFMAGSRPHDFTALSEIALFVASKEDGEAYLWSSDGTTARTQPLTKMCESAWAWARTGALLPSSSAPEVAVFENSCDPLLNGHALWRTDGTPEGTYALATGLWDLELSADFRPNALDSTLGGRYYFGMRTAEGAPLELWATDGTIPGTGYVTTLDVPSDLRLRALARVGPLLHVFAGAGYGPGLQIFVTDGTAGGTYRAVDLSADCAAPNAVSVAGRQAFFVAPTRDGPGDEYLGDELWVTDGTLPGTRRLTYFPGDSPLAWSYHLKALGEEVFFLAHDPSWQWEFWRSDGTPAGTFPLTHFGQDGSPIGNPDGTAGVETLHGRLFFLGHGTDGSPALWASDREPGVAHRVKRICDLPFYYFDRAWLLRLGETLIFPGCDGAGIELWASDGTRTGTRAIADLLPGKTGGEPANAVVNGDSIFFTARDADGNRQLWLTRGSTSTTLQLSDSWREPLAEAWDSLDLAQTGEYRLLAARDETHGFELWRIGEGAGSATLLADLTFDRPGLELAESAVRGPEIAFSTKSDLRGTFHVYRSDGTRTGTLEIAAAGHYSCGLVYGNAPPDVQSLPEGVLVLEDDCGSYGALRGWRRADGALAPLFSNDPAIRPGLVTSAVALAGETLVLLVTDSRVQVWTTDGTDEGTRLRTEIADASSGFAWDTVSGRLLLQLHDAVSESTLYALDLATWQLESLETEATAELSLGDFTVIDGIAYAIEEPYGLPLQLWRTDGAAPGTFVLETFPPEHHVASPLLTLDRRAFFSIHNWQSGLQLWVSDGTPQGTSQIGAIPSASYGPLALGRIGDRALFQLWISEPEPPYSHSELWESDGSVAGTRLLGRLETGDADAGIRAFIETTGPLFFESEDGDFGQSLWTTDGTLEGTIPLWKNPQLAAGWPGDPLEVSAIGSMVAFSGFEPEQGLELYVSDGTPTGTGLLADLWPGPESSAPRDFVLAAGLLYFTADDGVHGRELWAMRATGAEPCVPGPTVLCLLGGRFSVSMTGAGGAAAARPLTAAAGAFQRPGELSPDTFVKMIDGSELNARQWFFAADLVDPGFSLRVVDTASGIERTWIGGESELSSFGDISAFATFPVPTSVELPEAALAPQAGVVCEPSDRRLCFAGGRIAVDAARVGFDGEVTAAFASPVAIASDEGAFYFFAPETLELAVRLRETEPGRYSLSVASLTNLGYVLSITDLATGRFTTIESPVGTFLSQAREDLFPPLP